MKNFINNKKERAKNDLNKYKKWTKKHSLTILIVLNILAWINLFSIQHNLIHFLFSVLNISKLESQKDQIEVLIKLITVLGATISIGLVTWRSTIANDNNKLQQKQEINERYAKAVELLGHKSEAVRIGALYTLEHISREKNADYSKTSMDVIAGYVRNQTIKFNKEQPVEKTEETNGQIHYFLRPLSEDIKTAVNILSRRNDTEKINLKGLDWSYVDLKNVDIEFENLDFTDSDFESIVFGDFKDLSSCILIDVELEGADLENTILKGTNLRGADLTEARGLTLEQLKSAIIDEDTILPFYLRQHKPELLLRLLDESSS